MEWTGGIADFFNPMIEHMDWIAWLVLSINLLLVLFARQIILLTQHDREGDASFTWKLRTLRAFNILIIIGYFYFNVYETVDNHGPGIRMVAIIATIYIAYLAMYLSHYLILRRFGREIGIEGENRHSDTYNSRLLNILSNLFIGIIALITIVRLLGFETLLEAGGVIGFIGVFLALTQSSWAPDIFGGLIILNSDLLKEGDVIELHDSEEIIGTVFRTKIFHTEILNLINNHRIMVSNARLREYPIHNLSRFASARGLRENLHFKIGYDCDTATVRNMFEAAFERAKERADISLQEQYPLEIGVHENGDHAVEWVVFYYIKDVAQILKTRQQMQELFLTTAKEHAISLATPITHQQVTT